MMQAVRKLSLGKGKVELVETDEPEIGPRDVLMKVWAAGVCGSDLNIQNDTHFYRVPVTLGHEFSGVAVKVGSEVSSVKLGDKIVADIEADEGWLGVEIDGSYANYMRIPERSRFRNLIHVLPSDMSLDAGAMVEPVVATVHCLQERSSIKAGDFVVVIGPGPMGILAVEMAKIHGASQTVLVGLKEDEMRLGVGKKIGADQILYNEDDPVKTVMGLTDGKGADIVVECSGSETGLQNAIEMAKHKGQITLVGMWGKKIMLSFDRVSMSQLNLTGGWSWNGEETWRRAINLLYSRKIDYEPLITHRLPLEDWEKAFALIRAKKALKILLYPNGRKWTYK